MNTNGVISFSVPVSQFTPDRFPLRDKRGRIAPFWGDVDTRNGGVVFYRESTDTACYRERLETFAGRLGQLGFL